MLFIHLGLRRLNRGSCHTLNSRYSHALTLKKSHKALSRLPHFSEKRKQAQNPHLPSLHHPSPPRFPIKTTSRPTFNPSPSAGNPRKRRHLQPPLNPNHRETLPFIIIISTIVLSLRRNPPRTIATPFSHKPSIFIMFFTREPLVMTLKTVIP